MSDRKTGLLKHPATVPAVLGVLLLLPTIFPFVLMGREAFSALKETVHGELARGLPGALLALWIVVQAVVAVWLLARARRLARPHRRG